MRVKYFKYLSPFLLYAQAYIAFTQTGFATWATLLYAWVLIPLAEMFLVPDHTNLEAAESEMAKRNRFYDFMLYLVVIYQYFMLYIFIRSFQQQDLLWWEIAGRILTMGLLCGTFGINVAHELGHRKNKAEQWLARVLLTTSLYVHFFIEHNKGHHKHVATPEDPSSARFNENVYSFFFRTLSGSYVSAWNIANKECRDRKMPVISLHNEMITGHLMEVLLLMIVYVLGGAWVTLYFIVAAFTGILLLETVNYIEHYGLQRKPGRTGYERAMPWHSWNSNHPIGRIMLFELSRHSDHHFMASRKYQLLQHHQDAPQLPTGYPGSMILAMIPPAWFRVMNKKIKSLQTANNITT